MPDGKPKKRVLIVDDSPTALSHAVTIIEKDFLVVKASSAMEAYKLALADPPSAIILDLEMPEMTGIDLLRLLRKDVRTQKVPVLVSTTVTEVERVNECRRLGCSGFVLKPLREEYVLAKLRTMLGT